MVSAEGQKITQRFFEAVEVLISRRDIRGQKTLSNELGIDNSIMCKLKKEPEIFTLKPEHIRYIVVKYNVSAHWIITGRGKMFTR